MKEGRIQSNFDFNEKRPEFSGFNRFYSQEIAPYLASREVERKQQIANGKLRGGAVAVLGVCVAIYCYARFGVPATELAPKLVSAILPILVGGAVGYAVLQSHIGELQKQIKSFLMERMCGFIGWEYTEQGFAPPVLGIYQNNDLLPGRIDRQTFEDQMNGQAHGADFTFCEAKLERKDKDSKGRTQWRTVFRGILLEIDFHREFIGRTVVLRDSGIFNAKKKSGMKRVGLVDPVFEKIFEAYGTDQVEARYLLTPTFMQRLVDLEKSVEGKNARFGFIDGKLHIAIDAADQFVAGSMFQSLLDTARTQTILSELDAIFNVIDGVMKPLEKPYS